MLSLQNNLNQVDIEHGDIVQQEESDENNNLETEETNSFSEIHKMHMIQTLQGLLFIKSLQEVSQEEIDSK